MLLNTPVSDRRKAVEYRHGLYILAVLWLGSGQSVLANKQDVLNNNLAK